MGGQAGNGEEGMKNLLPGFAAFLSSLFTGGAILIGTKCLHVNQMFWSSPKGQLQGTQQIYSTK